MREGIWQGIETLVSDIDGSEAFRLDDHAVSECAADSGDLAAEESPGMVWDVEEDDDDLEFSITAPALAVLVARGRRHCEGCAGTCGR